MVIKSIIGATCACLTVVSIDVNAALLSRLNGQAIYDTDLNITWLANSNLATTETFGVNGIYTDTTIITAIMNLETANNWISAMNTDGGTGYLGINSWRLPKTITPDSGCTTLQGIPITNSTGYNCSLSEMGHLFYNEFGGIAGEHVRDNTNPAVSLFSFPVDPEVLVGFWSGTQPTTTQAFVFGFNVGGQGIIGSSNNFNAAWAVADGDVAAVPVPAAVWLFGSGLALIGFTRRKA